MARLALAAVMTAASPAKKAWSTPSSKKWTAKARRARKWLGAVFLPRLRGR